MIITNTSTQSFYLNNIFDEGIKFKFFIVNIFPASRDKSTQGKPNEIYVQLVFQYLKYIITGDISINTCIKKI